MKIPDTFMPPLSFHALAALIALALCGAGAWVARQEHHIRALWRACVVGMFVALLTLPAASAAWSGPQLIRNFWDQVFMVSGHGNVSAVDRVWVQPALAETSGVLCFGILYAVCVLAAARCAAKYLLGVGGLSHSHRRILGRDGVASCWRCGHQLGELSACPECALAHCDLPPKGWPWNSRWFRTRRARRVALLLFVGTAVTVSAALPLIVGVAQVLFRRM